MKRQNNEQRVTVLLSCSEKGYKGYLWTKSDIFIWGHIEGEHFLFHQEHLSYFCAFFFFSFYDDDDDASFILTLFLTWLSSSYHQAPFRDSG